MAPADLLYGRKLRSRLDLLRPNLRKQVSGKQTQQKQNYDGDCPRVREFKVNEHVYVRNYSRGAPWVRGQVESTTGPLSYTVRLSDGRTVRRHIDQMREGTWAEEHKAHLRDNFISRDKPVFTVSVTGGGLDSDQWEIPLTEATDNMNSTGKGTRADRTTGEIDETRKQLPSSPLRSKTTNETPTVTPTSAVSETAVRRSMRTRRQPSRLDL